ncbi:MAG: sigma-70 family RNA polymerase sigma factor [Deltaproteobacteria bacterium]|nr:sigma-70 family RNA polymerase sigma factor [Deltaproteobacteria bacterium]
MTQPAKEDWAAVVEDVIRGDRVAFLKLSRLITGFLANQRAFDMRNDWDDVVQDVVLATIEAKRKQTLREPQAVYGYVRSTTHFKFVDRIRDRKRTSVDSEQVDSAERAAALVSTNEVDLHADVLEAVDRLPENQRIAVVRVYAEGMTYDEAAEQTGIPLGSLKRYLRQGLAAIHESLNAGST